MFAGRARKSQEALKQMRQERQLPTSERLSSHLLFVCVTANVCVCVSVAVLTRWSLWFTCEFTEKHTLTHTLFLAKLSRGRAQSVGRPIYSAAQGRGGRYVHTGNDFLKDR